MKCIPVTLAVMAYIAIFTSSCAQKPPAATPVHRATSNVGDIPFDASMDDSSFRVCDTSRILQYYNTDSWFLDHKDSIRNYFIQGFRGSSGLPRQTGYITIKFIINCEGVTGRFRLTEMDSTYRPFHFDTRISGQLLNLARQLNGWQPAYYHGKYYDSYQYITFHIRNGEILTISP